MQGQKTRLSGEKKGRRSHHPTAATTPATRRHPFAHLQRLRPRPRPLAGLLRAAAGLPAAAAGLAAAGGGSANGMTTTQTTLSTHG